MDPRLEWSMWRQLRGAFGIDRFVFTPVVEELSQLAVDQYPTMEEALDSCVGPFAFLEPKGTNSVSALPSGGDLVFVLGNARMNNLKHADPSETYRIQSPGATDMYGINAAAIALAVRYGQ
jgi:hypothetical protein